MMQTFFVVVIDKESDQVTDEFFIVAPTRKDALGFVKFIERDERVEIKDTISMAPTPNGGVIYEA